MLVFRIHHSPCFSEAIFHRRPLFDLFLSLVFHLLNQAPSPPPPHLHPPSTCCLAPSIFPSFLPLCSPAHLCGRMRFMALHDNWGIVCVDGRTQAGETPRRGGEEGRTTRRTSRPFQRLILGDVNNNLAQIERQRPPCSVCVLFVVCGQNFGICFH